MENTNLEHKRFLKVGIMVKNPKKHEKLRLSAHNMVYRCWFSNMYVLLLDPEYDPGVEKTSFDRFPWFLE